MGCPKKCSVGDNLTFSITTHDPLTGVLTDADSAPTYRIYRNENEEIIGNGTMSKLDDANTTGFYAETILCDHTSRFEDGKTYTIYIEATVSSDTGATTYEFKTIGTQVPFVRRQTFIPISWH